MHSVPHLDDSNWFAAEFHKWINVDRAHAIPQYIDRNFFFWARADKIYELNEFTVFCLLLLLYRFFCCSLIIAIFYIHDSNIMYSIQKLYSKSHVWQRKGQMAMWLVDSFSEFDVLDHCSKAMMMNFQFGFFMFFFSIQLNWWFLFECCLHWRLAHIAS